MAANGRRRLVTIVLIAACGATAGCEREGPPRIAPGDTGFVSDRAVELRIDIAGHRDGAHGPIGEETVREDLRALDARLAAEGRPLHAERARIEDLTVEVRGPVTAYRARAISYVSAYDGVDVAVYRAGAADGVRGPDPAALGARPDDHALAADGELTVGILFGQMDKERLTPGDPGHGGVRAFGEALEAAGFERLPDPVELPGRRYRGVEPASGLVIDVRLHGPDAFPLGLDAAATAAVLRAVAGPSEVVYLNGHARQEGLDALADPAVWVGVGYRVVVLDLCWSYPLYARPVLEAHRASGGRAHVVSALERVVTGSEESFHALFVHLVRGAAAPGTTPDWLDLVTEMNALAEARAAERRDRVGPALRPPEIYGVSTAAPPVARETGPNGNVPAP